MKRVGLALSVPLDMQRLVQVVQRTEQRGLDSFWVTEGVARDAFSQLAALAMRSERIKLGTAIVNVFSRSPTLLAMTASSMDDLSGGRFILGLGSGHRTGTEERHGVPFGQPLERMRDYVGIIRQAVSGQPVSYEGAAYRVPSFRPGYAAPSGQVPIYLAALGLKMARLAGEVADGVILHLATLEHVKRVREAVAQGAAAAGRDPAQVEMACFIMCNASGDGAKARQEVVRSVAYYGAMPYYRNLLRLSGFQDEAEGLHRAWSRDDAQGAAGCVTERMLEAVSVSAGAEETRDRIRAYREVGVTLPLLYPVSSREDAFAAAMDSLEAVAAS